MAMRGPMRNELFKYRKRKNISLDGSIPGVPYTPLRRSRRHVSGMPYRPSSSNYHHRSYMGNMPREYHPRLNSPGVGWSEYDSHESSHISFARTPPIRTGSSHNFSRNAPGMLSVPTDDLALDELWSMATLRSSRPQEGPIGMSADEFAFVNSEVRTNLDLRDDLKVRPLPGLSEITDVLSQLEKVLPQDHPDIINLAKAADTLTGGQFSADRQISQISEPFSIMKNSYITDPHEEAEQFFNQQMQILDKSFELAEPVTDQGFEGIAQQDEQLLLNADQMMSIPTSELDTGPQEMLVDGDTLEQIIENEVAAFGPQQQFIAEDMMPMIDTPGPQMTNPMEQDFGYGTAPVVEEINQAIDQLQQMQYGPPMMPEYMVDPMQQFMPDYMMPGFGPMNPGFGPMGSMPMPGP